MLAPPAPEELLRLARKAGIVKPDWEPHRPKTLSMQLCSALGTWLTVIDLSGPPGVNVREPAQAAALHAALLVLSGELDVAALLAERDRLREFAVTAIAEMLDEVVRLRAERDSLRETVNDAFIAIAKENP